MVRVSRHFAAHGLLFLIACGILAEFLSSRVTIAVKAWIRGLAVKGSPLVAVTPRTQISAGAC